MRTPCAGTTTDPDPPTPQPIDVEGELHTIAEEDEMENADELVIETFYAKLTSDYRLQRDPEMTMILREQDGREEEVQLPMHPIQMM